MTLPHRTLCTANMKQQIEFFTDKLGMELVALKVNGHDELERYRHPPVKTATP